MGDLAETIKGWLIAGLKLFVIVTIAVLIIFGPKEAAGFVTWVGDQLAGIGSSSKEFVQEVKN